jgi:hypothetical protein
MLSSDELLAADAAGSEGPHVVTHLFECVGQRRELALVEVLNKVFLDAAAVHGSRRL